MRVSNGLLLPHAVPAFNFTTGDAAGQNMVGKATFVACEWIVANYYGIKRYMLSGAMDTDKKHSQLNTLHSRGK